MSTYTDKKGNLTVSGFLAKTFNIASNEVTIVPFYQQDARTPSHHVIPVKYVTPENCFKISLVRLVNQIMQPFFTWFKSQKLDANEKKMKKHRDFILKSGRGFMDETEKIIRVRSESGFVSESYEMNT